MIESPSAPKVISPRKKLNVAVNKKAQETIRLVEQGMLKGQTACMPELVRIINTLSMNIQDLPIYQLSEMIQNDPIILQKVIDAANKIGYNPLNIPVDSLSSAIQVVGFDRVRSLTMSMILLENAQKENYSNERQKAALHALSSGIMAQRIAKNVKQHVNEDTAFVCGALRGYGAILLATYLPKETEAVEAKSNHTTRSKIYQDTFGLSHTELTRRIMRKAEMPEMIIAGVSDFNTHAPEDQLSERLDPSDLLGGISEFGYLLTQAALDPNVSKEDYTSMVQSLEARFRKVIRRDLDFYNAELQYTHEYISKLRYNTAARAFPQNGFDCLKARFLHKNPPKPQKGDGSYGGDFMSGYEAGVVQHLAGSTEYWNEQCNEIEGFEIQNGLSTNVVDHLFKVLAKGFEPDEIWLFLPKDGNKQKFHLSRCMGTHEMVLGRKTAIQVREESIFGLCLRRREIMIIRDARQKQIQPHLPSWYRERVDLNSFVLCSVHHREQPAGLIYVGWRSAKNFQIQKEKAPLLRKILAQIAALSIQTRS